MVEVLGDILLVPELALHALTSIHLGQINRVRAEVVGMGTGIGMGMGRQTGMDKGMRVGMGMQTGMGMGVRKEMGMGMGTVQSILHHRAAHSLFAPGEGIPCMATNEQPQGCRRAPAVLEVRHNYCTAHLCC